MVGHYPKLRGHVPICKGSRRVQVEIKPKKLRFVPRAHEILPRSISGKTGGGGLHQPPGTATNENQPRTSHLRGVGKGGLAKYDNKVPASFGLLREDLRKYGRFGKEGTPRPASLFKMGGIPHLNSRPSGIRIQD